MINKAEKIIHKLRLEPHPEGGYYRQTYKSPSQISTANLGNGYSSTRAYSTCIYFLLTSDTFSRFHRITQDEIWHFYHGSPIKLHVITKDGDYMNYTIGSDVLNGEQPQLVVNGGNWFAAEIIEEDNYALVGCSVAPGFDFDDFEMINQQELLKLFPKHKIIIEKLTD
jgi:predicted cupin superfamily sugar epimerase